MVKMYHWMEKAEKDVSFMPYETSGERFERIEGMRQGIESVVGGIRKSVDKWMVKGWEKQRTPENSDRIDKLIQKYPIGFCGEITLKVLDTILHPENKLTFTDMKNDGSPVKKVFGIHSNRYFQNAMQIGHLYVDPANDTVSKTKNQVEIIPIDKCPLEMITSYDQVLPIVESYWGGEIFPNCYFPKLSLFCPAITVFDGKPYFLFTPLDSLANLEVRSDFALAKNFLFNSKYSSKRLTTDQVQDLAYRVDQIAERRIDKISMKVDPASCNNKDRVIKAIKTAKTPVREHDFAKRFEKILEKRNVRKEKVDSSLYVLAHILASRASELGHKYNED